MAVTVHPCTLKGRVYAPSSKSYTQRMLILAAFSDSPSVLICNNLCADVITVIDCLKALGAKITVSGDRIDIVPVRSLPAEKVSLNCGDSGAALRFLLPIVCALGVKADIIMSKSLSRRPLSGLIGGLIRCGADIENRSENTISVSDGLSSNRLSVGADVSSQYVSGALLALAVIGGGEVDIISDISSAPYIEMTVDCMQKCGVSVTQTGNVFSVHGKPQLCGVHHCEGDWSGASFWLCAAAIGKEPVSVAGLNLSSHQGDRAIIEILRQLGAELTICDDEVTVTPGECKPIEIDADNIPDLVPAVSILCANADGDSRISNVHRLRSKESDRVNSVIEMLGSLGGKAECINGDIIIHGTGLSGGAVRTYSDHRIAMTAAIAANSAIGAIILDDHKCYAKSYSEFERDFLLLGGRI